jgi:uncharacterized protein YjeT (DUF2065 family)
MKSRYESTEEFKLFLLPKAAFTFSKVMNEEEMQTRILALILLCAGIGIYYLDYTMRHGSNGYYPMLTFLAPLLIAVSLNLIIEAPKLPQKQLSIFGWICVVIGGAIGFWNVFF